ncbi:MAG: IclR family transcriptional regulator [Polynucleobacter sp.]|nr:MAG: IclR family transcriptional regulator [Polynucleobacter sp.]
MTTHTRKSSSNSVRSLERGLEILRAFRPGTDLLGNGELAEKTGLSKSTVSRLTQTLVQSGFLYKDEQAKAYRLAAPVLSLSHTIKTSSPILQVAQPLMVALSEKLQLNIGLAVADSCEMVYLEAVRYNKKTALRNIVMGHRVPMELTSLGRAWLAANKPEIREKTLEELKVHRSKDWGKISSEINQAILETLEKKYCSTAWLPEVVAISTPIEINNHPIYVLNMSRTTKEDLNSFARNHSKELLNLAKEIKTKVSNLNQ